MMWFEVREIELPKATVYAGGCVGFPQNPVYTGHPIYAAKALKDGRSGAIFAVLDWQDGTKEWMELRDGCIHTFREVIGKSGTYLMEALTDPDLPAEEMRIVRDDSPWQMREGIS